MCKTAKEIVDYYNENYDGRDLVKFLYNDKNDTIVVSICADFGDCRIGEYNLQKNILEVNGWELLGGLNSYKGSNKIEDAPINYIIDGIIFETINSLENDIETLHEFIADLEACKHK